ncbi:MAG: serine/threonine protein kinase [Proteobacteria bacterium]|nr:serine/threonine protein kinase [Pseudomonadota bacterium]
MSAPSPFDRADTQPEPAPYPRPFGSYLLVAPLARGGMGELHLALSAQSDLRKLYVIKQILPQLTDHDFAARFAEEVRLAAQLSHGNLVPVFEGGRIEGRYYLVMEYIEGKDLRTVWGRLGQLDRRCPLPVALHVAREVCRALEYVHTFADLGLVHRDISPPNVLLSYSGEVRITDFGLAVRRVRVQHTAPGILFGKLSYMPPEQALRGTLDARTDVYATGVVLWELATGQRLFPREGTQRDRLHRAAHPQVPPPSTIDPALPPELDAIIARSLAPRGDDRYASAELMRRDLAALLARLAPTTDATSVQQLLFDLYGAQIEDERRARSDLVAAARAPAARQQASRTAAVLMAEQVPGVAAAALRKPPHGRDTTTAPIQRRPSTTARAVAAARLPVGTILGDRYRIDGLIGEGGMGMVYSATHLGLDKGVAVKVLHELYGNQPDAVWRFRHEARAASRIGHPNIIAIYDSGTTDDGAVYFAMEHLDGQDLADVLRAEGRLDVERTVRIGAQICEALAAAHQAGIIHRDLKPENVFLTAREGNVDFVKVLDFGIAQALPTEGVRHDLTSPGVAMGTPEYMAPEQATGRACDHRSDIYSVGSMLYEMLAGQPPHWGETVVEIFDHMASGSITPLREHRPELPEELVRTVHWALAAAPEDRPQSMAHLAYELNKLASGRAGAVASILGLSNATGGAAGSAGGPPLGLAETGSFTPIAIQLPPALLRELRAAPPVEAPSPATPQPPATSDRAPRRAAPISLSRLLTAVALGLLGLIPGALALVRDARPLGLLGGSDRPTARRTAPLIAPPVVAPVVAPPAVAPRAAAATPSTDGGAGDADGG